MKTQETTLTAQMIFDATVLHLAAQGKRSMNAHVGCAYRGENGARCAVGIHLTDDEFLPEMEGKQVRGLMNLSLLPVRFVPFQSLLRRLQGAHDDWFHTKLYDHFLAIAKEFRLDDSSVRLVADKLDCLSPC